MGLNYQKTKELVNTRRAESPSGDSSFKSSLAKYQAKAPTSSLAKYRDPSKQYTENGAEIIGEYEPLTNAPKRTVWDDIKGAYKHIGQTGNGFLTIAMSLADRVATRVEQAAYVIGEDMKDGNPFNAISDEERAERRKTLDAMEYRTQDVTSSLGKFRSTIQNKQDKDRQDMSQMGQGAQLVVGAIESLPSTVVSKIPYAGMAINGVASYDQAMDSLYNDMQATGVEIPADKARLYSLGVAAVEAGSEMMFPAGSATAKGVSTLLTKAPAKGLLGRAAQRLATYLAKDSAGDIIIPTVGRQLKSLAIEAAQEGAEEVVSSIGQGLLAEALIHPEKKLFGWDDANINAKDALLSFAGGALAGGMFSGVMGLAYYPKARAFVESKTGLKIRQMTEQDIEGFLKAAREDFKSPDAQAELTDQLTRNLALSTSTGQFVTDPKTGAGYRVSAPDPETGMVMLFGSDGAEDLVVTPEQLAQNFTAPASAVTDSSLPVTDGSSPAAGVAPNIIERQTATGETVPMFTEPLPDGGTVTAEATGKSVLLTVAPKTGAPYSFEVDAEEYSRAMATGSPLPALLAASGRNKEQGNLGRYIARAGLTKSARDVWTAVDRATKTAFDDRVSRTKAEAEAKETAKQTEEVKQAEKELEEAKTAGEKTQVKTKTKALRDKARKVQETAVKKGQMAERHLKALLKMDQQNEAQGFDTYYNVLPEGKQSALQKKLAQIVAAANGKEVVWIYNAAGEDAIDGFVAGETDSTVYINADVKTNALQTIGHELFHQARKAGLTKAFEQAVLASTKMTKDQLIQAYADKYASQADYFDYLQANPEIALEEALADKAGEVFATPEFLQKFAERAGQAKFDAFIQKVKDWLQKIRDVAPEEVDTLLEALTAKVEAKNDLGINAETQQIMDEHGYDPGKFAVRPTIEAAKEGSIKIEMALIKDKIKAENPGLSDAKLKKLIRAEAEKRTEQVRQVVEMTGSIFEAITSRYPEYLSRMLEETGHTHFGPIRENKGGYVYTFDLDTLCTRAIKFRAQTDALINKLGRFPDEHELTAMLFWMRESGDLIPCVYCYVESKRRLKMDAFNVWSNTKFNIASGITPNMTLAQAKKAFGATMYGTDEKGKMTDAGETVFKRWFEEAKSGSLRPMAGTELFRGYQTVRKDIFARFDKEFNPKAKSRNTELERVTALIADELGVEDRKGKTAFAWRSLNTLATEWNYYAQSPGEKPVVYTSLETVSDPVAYLHNMAEATDYSNSVSSAKGVELFEHYTDQLTSVSVINKIAMNAHGGFRIHSSNDFRVDHAMDYVLFVTHLAQDRRGGEGWKSHMYTKSVECARFLANTHIKINCSIAFNTQPNGEITVNDKEGMPLKDIIQLRELSPDIGSMAMVTDDAQLEYCLNAPWVDQIIPFHMSGMKKAIWDSVLGWSDYTSVQSDDWPNAEYRAEHPDLDEKIKHRLFTREKVMDPETGVKVEKLVPYKPAFLPFDKIIPGLFYEDGSPAIDTTYPVTGWKIPGWARATETEGVKAYFELCQDYGVMPRFWMHRLSDGTRLTDHPNYVKLIKETSRMDTPHRDVEANFDHKQIYDMTEDFAKRGGYENIERPNLTELDYFMRTFFDEVDGEYVFRKDMSPLKANIMSLIKVGGIDLSRLTPSQIRDNKDLIKEYFTETASGFAPTSETKTLIAGMLSRAPKSLLKAYGLPEISTVENLADQLEQDVFFNYLDPATVEGKLALQNTLNAQQENPGSLTWLKHLPLVQQAETPERMARAVEILESWSKDSSLYTTRAQQLRGVTNALGLARLEDEVRGVLRGKGLLYSVRQGKLPAKATKSSLVDTVFDAFKGAKKPEPVDFIGMDAYDLRQVAAMAMLVRDPRVEHRHIYAIKHGVVVHHESWTSNLPAAAYALPENPEVYKRLMDRLQLIQPTRIVFSHNHPSGDPTPSQADKDATQKMVQMFPGKVYDGEIITDHNTYSYIAPNGDVRTGVFRQNQDREAIPAKYNWAKKRGKDVNYDSLHAWVSAQKILPDLALREGDPTLIYLDNKLRVTGVQHVSNQLLRDRSAFTKHVTDSKPNFSAMHVLAYAADENSADLLRGYWNGNVLRDVIDASRVREDQYLYQEGHRAPSPDFGAPAHDLVTTGMYPSDVYSPQGLRYYGTGDTREDAKVWNMLKAMRGNPEAKVTVYRAVPGHVDTINPGDWVAITKDYAQKHADHVLSGMSPRILTKTVTAKELYTNGDSWSEWGYHPAGTQLGESLDRFGGEVGGIPAFTSPFSQWLFAMHEKDPNKKRAAQEWDALITKAPFKSGYEYEFLGIKDWLLQQKSLTASELMDYYVQHSALMDEWVYANPDQWSTYSPSREFKYDMDRVRWANYRASVITIDPKAIPQSFSNGDSRMHFPQADRLLMHTRMEDVTTPEFPNGATYLIEAQSDLHSAGQQSGYTPKEELDGNTKEQIRQQVADFLNRTGALEGIDAAAEELRGALAEGRKRFAKRLDINSLAAVFRNPKAVVKMLESYDFDVDDVLRYWRDFREKAATSPDAVRVILAADLDYDLVDLAGTAMSRTEKAMLLASAAGVQVKESHGLIELDGVSNEDAADAIIRYLKSPGSNAEARTTLRILQDNYNRSMDAGTRESIRRLLTNLASAQRFLDAEEDPDNLVFAVTDLQAFANYGMYESELDELPVTQALRQTLREEGVDDMSMAVQRMDEKPNLNPEVPFGKDYMLLGFKTALRDAVNAGHDAVLWAGWMHAKRWHVNGNLIYAKVLEKRDTGITLEYQTAGMSSPEIKSFVLDLGSANGLNMEPEFGVENAAKLRASKTGDTVFGQSRTALLGMGVQRHPDTDEIIEDAGPTFGKMYNNMIPRMYDEELVSQVKKYAKQWGVEPEYKQVEGLPGYQWVFPVTQPVRDALRSRPQVAYSVRAQRSFSRAYAEEFLSKGTRERITEAHLFYDIQPNRVTMAAAAAILNSGRAKAEALARNVNAFRDAASTALRLYFMLEADLQGNHEAAAEWALIAAQAGTTLGQAVQAYAMLRKLSSGSLQLLTARKLNQLLSQDDREQVDRVASGIFAQLNKIDQNKVDELLAKDRLAELQRLIETEEGRAEALQQRLAKLESDLLYYENDPVRQYVEALHDIAAATVPYQDMYQGTDLRGFIKWAIDHPELTSRMWELAHDTLHNLHYADSEFMEQIEGYFGDYLPKRRRNSLKLTRRSYEEIIAAIKEHFAAEDHTANALIARLKELGVDPADATLIAHSMTEQLAKLTKRQKLTSLTRLLPVMRRGGRATRDKLERMINLANEIGVNEATVKANIANLMGLPGLTPELQAELSQIAKEIGAIQAFARKQARPLTEEESRMVDFKMAILLSRIQQQKPARVGDKIENFRYMMMLSWIKPAERNIIGNALFFVADTFKDTIAATLDIAAAKTIGINRAVPYPDLKAALQGMLKGFRYGKEDIKAGVNTSELDTQYSINQGQMYRSKTMKTLTAIYRFKMALPDRIAQTAAYESHLAGLKRLNDSRKPEERMSAEDLHEQALLFAAKKTFTDDNIISQTFSELRASLNLLSTLGHTTRWGLGSVLLPFTKVPGALLMRTLEYSPLSIGRAMAYLVKHTYAVGWRGEGKAEWHKKYQKKFSTALADAGWGTLTTLVLGAFLRSIGVITGEPPEDSQEYNLRKVMGVGRGYLLNWSALRRCFANGFDAEAAAWQDGDFLSTYSWLAPMSLGMSIGANWWDLRQTLTGKDGTYYGSWASELLLAVASGTQSIMDLSMMQGVAQLMDTGYASNFRFTPEGETQRPFYLENFLNVAVSYPSSFVPNELKMLREAIDNTQRNVYDQNYLRYAYWLVLNKLPGASKLLAPKYDVLGNELKVYQTSGWKRYLDLAVNPALTNKLILDENAMLVMDVYLNKTVDDSVRLPTAKRYLVKSEMVNGQKIETKVPLTAKEQAELQRVIGTRIDEAISRVPRNISVDAQAAQIHDIISKESKRTIAELLAWKEMQSGG